jgi:hypothetical protein
MANVCFCYMTINGNAEQLDDLRKKIRDQDKKSLDELFTWFLVGNYYGLVQDPQEIAESGELCLEFTCKWSPPETELESLAEAYPELTFEVRYEESGCELYGTLSYAEGSLTSDVSYEEDIYLEKFDEEYAEFIQNLDDTPYDKFLEEVLKDLEGIEEADTCRYAHLAEEKYLAKMKDEDLPLLINYRWQYGHNKTEYERRLKGPQHAETSPTCQQPIPF